MADKHGETEKSRPESRRRRLGRRAGRGASRLLLWLGGGLLILLALVVGGLLFLASSETALRWAWNTAEPMLPEGVEIATVEGRLIGPLRVTGVKVDTDSIRLRLDSAFLDWRPGDLVGRLLNIHSIQLEGLEYTALPVEEEVEQPTGEPFEMPESIRLPIDIQLNEFVLNGAKIYSAPQAEPFVVDQARVAAALRGDDWQVSELSANGPLFEVKGGVKLVPTGRYANQAQFRWVFRAPDIAPLEGNTQLQGDLDRLELTQVIAAPYNLKASAIVSDPLEALRLQADIVLDSTRLPAIRDDLPPATLNVQARAQGSLDDLGLTLDLKASETEFGTALAELAARYSGDSVTIEKLNVSSPETPGVLQASGQVGLAQGKAMDLRIDWQKLQWPLSGDAAYASPAGQFDLTGQFENYRLAGGLDWLLPESPDGGPQAGRLDLAGDGTLSSFNLETLSITGAPGTLKGQADIIWAPSLDARIALNGKHLNPGAVVAGWPGDFSLDLEASARQQGDQLFAMLENLSADGELRGQPLNLEARAKYSPEEAVLERLKLIAGETRVTASGRILDTLDLQFEIDSSDLSTTVPGAQGRLAANGQAQGALDRPRVALTMRGEDLIYQGNLLDSVDLDAELDPGGNSRSSVTLQLEKGQFGAFQLNTLGFNLRGTPDNHELGLEVDAAEGELSLGMSGALPEDFAAWRFTLDKLHARYDELAAWDLQAAASGLLSADSQQLGQTCLGSGNARLCLQGENGAEGLDASFTLDDLDYAYAKPLLPRDPKITGTLSARGDVRLPANGELDARVELNTSGGTVTTRTQDGEAIQVLSLEPGVISASVVGDALDAKIDLPLSQGGGINARAAVAAGNGDMMDRPLDGAVNIQVEALDFISEITAEVETIKGQLTGQMNLGGSLNSPRITGRTDLKTSQLALVTPGLEIKNLHLALVGRGDVMDISLDARSGEGTLDVDGDVNLADRGQTINLAVKGNSFKIIDNNEARAFASPDLRVAVRPERIDVTGTVAIPKAEITPRNLPESGAVTISSDQLIVSPRAEEQASGAGRALHAEVRVIIGDPAVQVTEFVERGRNFDDLLRRLPDNKVSFDGFGLKAVIAGELLVTQNPGKPALGTGELRVVLGEYKAYGQDLSIRNGKILFGGGPVAEPAVNIRAVRRPSEDILVGVRVRGRLEQPNFTLFSEPGSMTQSEQLSWLVLGRPLSGASSSETSLMTRAALALGLKGGNVLTSKVGKRLGVDELGLESGSTSTGGEQASLVIGKYLTPKLYVSYGIGLFEPISTLRMRYTLTDRWQLETQSSGTGSGGDIIYSIERGK